MGDERIEVLKMVADKVITVEEAERLLRALDEGERRKSEAPPPRAERRRSTVVSEAFDGRGEVLGAIGEVVESTLSDALQGIEAGLGFEDEAEGGPMSFDVAPGTRISVRQSGRTIQRSACALVLVPGDDERCVVEAEPGSGTWTRDDDGRVRIGWRRGTLTVRVPASAAGVEARLFGGELRARDLRCPLDARILGGGMTLEQVREPVEVRGAGADLVVGLHPELHGTSRVASTGGAVTVRVPEGLSAVLDAAATSSELRIDPGVGRVRRDGHRYQGRATVAVGDGDPAARLEVKVVGGDLAVKAVGA